MVGLVGELATFSLPTTTGALVKGGIQREFESWQDSVFVPPLAPMFTIQLRTTKIQPVTFQAARACNINQSPIDKIDRNPPAPQI